MTRKLNDAIQIADSVSLHVISASGSRMKLAIDATTSMRERRSQMPRLEFLSKHDDLMNDLTLVAVCKPR